MTLLQKAAQSTLRSCNRNFLDIFSTAKISC